MGIAWVQLPFPVLWMLIEKQKKMICREEDGTCSEAERRDHMVPEREKLGSFSAIFE